MSIRKRFCSRRCSSWMKYRWHPRDVAREKLDKPLDLYLRNSRSPFATTIKLAPMSANTAIHIVACPLMVSSRNTA